MDPLAVHLTMQEALEHMRGGHGPTLIEADVYRYFHQNGPLPGQRLPATAPRRRRPSGAQRDPIDQVACHLVRRGILAADAIDAFAT